MSRCSTRSTRPVRDPSTGARKTQYAPSGIRRSIELPTTCATNNPARGCVCPSDPRLGIDLLCGPEPPCRRPKRIERDRVLERDDLLVRDPPERKRDRRFLVGRGRLEPEHSRLLEHELRRRLLLVRRIAVLAQDAADEAP